MPGSPTASVRFDADRLIRPPTRGIDVVATLEHFAIVSYAVDPDRVRPFLHPRFEPDTFTDADGRSKVLVSMVPFADQDFRFAALGWPRWRFGQTNYRTYVVDTDTGERAVWFWGTTLDSWTVAVPRHLWQLPWHRGRIRFDCAYDSAASRYERYRMSTTSDWAPVEIELQDSGQPITRLEGYPDLEAGLVILTHPLVGMFYRRDGELGTYRIWHDRLACTVGGILSARIGLFDRLGLVPFAEQSQPHSVLIQRATDFTIYLPPERIHHELGSPTPTSPAAAPTAPSASPGIPPPPRRRPPGGPPRA